MCVSLSHVKYASFHCCISLRVLLCKKRLFLISLFFILVLSVLYGLVRPVGLGVTPGFLFFIPRKNRFISFNPSIRLCTYFIKRHIFILVHVPLILVFFFRSVRDTAVCNGWFHFWIPPDVSLRFLGPANRAAAAAVKRLVSILSYSLRMFSLRLRSARDGVRVDVHTSFVFFSILASRSTCDNKFRILWFGLVWFGFVILSFRYCFVSF